MFRAMIFDIHHGSDGPDHRTTVFFKGCNLSCAWCGTPEGQHRLMQKMVYKELCIRCRKCENVCPCPIDCSLCGDCAAVCPSHAITICGKMLSTERIMQEILADSLSYGKNGGVTFSGGECMLQPDALEELLVACKDEGIHTAIDTAGNVPTETVDRLLPHTDLFLYNVKCADPKRHKEYTGVDNELILHNLRHLKKQGANIILRIPIIPDFNTDKEELMRLRAIIDEIAPQKVELLPYHTAGISKAAALGKKQREFAVPTADQMTSAKEILLK